jgi:hypothetical protein
VGPIFLLPKKSAAPAASVSIAPKNFHNHFLGLATVGSCALIIAHGGLRRTECRRIPHRRTELEVALGTPNRSHAPLAQDLLLRPSGCTRRWRGTRSTLWRMMCCRTARACCAATASPTSSTTWAGCGPSGTPTPPSSARGAGWPWTSDPAAACRRSSTRCSRLGCERASARRWPSCK